MYHSRFVNSEEPVNGLRERGLAGAFRDQPEAGLDDDSGEDEDDGHGDARVHEGGGGQGDAVGGAQDAAAEEDGPGGAVGALPFLRAGLDARQAQPQGRAAHAGARGQARREQVEPTRDESDGENQEGGDQSDVHGNPSKDKRFTAVSRRAARPFYPAPASSPRRQRRAAAKPRARASPAQK